MPFAKPMVTIELEEYNALKENQREVTEATETYHKGLEVILEGMHRGITPDRIGSELGRYGIMITRNSMNDEIKLVLAPKI